MILHYDISGQRVDKIREFTGRASAPWLCQHTKIDAEVEMNIADVMVVPNEPRIQGGFIITQGDDDEIEMNIARCNGCTYTQGDDDEVDMNIARRNGDIKSKVLLKEEMLEDR
ncbi:hypothetical protein J6590_057529 [Homalodisca vitripennis]|nr:hypothetical protein J6590_057529 [Homalodisca vitripennis]